MHPKLTMWTAKTEASHSVVHLDPCYFDSAAVGKKVRYAHVEVAVKGVQLMVRFFVQLVIQWDSLGTLLVMQLQTGYFFPDDPWVFQHHLKSSLSLNLDHNRAGQHRNGARLLQYSYHVHPPPLLLVERAAAM
jgi:hypothetical protein